MARSVQVNASLVRGSPFRHCRAVKWFVTALAFVGMVHAEPLVRDGKLKEGWTWRRENRTGWRVRDSVLEIRVEPGNMWGPANDAKNLLVRGIAPNTQVSITMSNKPTEQYEQVDLTWYYDDSHMVKIGQEMVDGKLSIVMGREEKDRTRTIAIIPIEAFELELRLAVTNNIIRGTFRPAGSSQWREAGSCDLPVHGEPHVAIQCYQGSANAEHWARIPDFTIRPLSGD